MTRGRRPRSEPTAGDVLDRLESREAAAVLQSFATCQGIVRGLHQVTKRKSHDGVLEYAPDFPGDAAGNTFATLLKESRKKHGRRWQPPDSFFDEVPPDWSRG
jgi:hypothetical protein